MFMFFICNKYINIKICSNVSIGKNASHMVFAQYLEAEFRDLQLVLSRWITIHHPHFVLKSLLQTRSLFLLELVTMPSTSVLCTDLKQPGYQHCFLTHYNLVCLY